MKEGLFVATKSSSERVHEMMKNFGDLHLQGFSISEIADKFNLTPQTVYLHLAEIAKNLEVSREDLLRQVHKTPAYWERQSSKLIVDANEVTNNFISIQEAIGDIQSDIDILLQIIAYDIQKEEISSENINI